MNFCIHNFAFDKTYIVARCASGAKALVKHGGADRCGAARRDFLQLLENCPVPLALISEISSMENSWFPSLTFFSLTNKTHR